MKKEESRDEELSEAKKKQKKAKATEHFLPPTPHCAPLPLPLTLARWASAARLAAALRRRTNAISAATAP